MESNYYQIVSEALSGQRLNDEVSANAVAVLRERLERVKSLGGDFAQIEFSPAVKKLIGKGCKVAVC